MVSSLENQAFDTQIIDIKKKIKAQEKSNHARIPLAARQADAQKNGT